MKLLPMNTRLYVERDRIMIDYPDELYIYRPQEMVEIAVLTTEQRIMKAKSFLVFVMCDEAYAISTIHPDYSKRTFEKLMDYYNVSSTAIIDAMQHEGDEKFVIARFKDLEQ